VCTYIIKNKTTYPPGPVQSHYNFYFRKINNVSQARLLKPVILATWEAEMGGQIGVKASPGKKFERKDPISTNKKLNMRSYLKTTRAKRAGDVTKVIEQA
jgi:hypothetical protein